jgi:hypothetical protein
VTAHKSDSTTLLSGSIEEQAAFYSLHLRMRDLGLMALSLEASVSLQQTEERAAFSACSQSPFLCGHRGTLPKLIEDTHEEQT